jgi:multidrug efflux pump subunit AcrB
MIYAVQISSTQGANYDLKDIADLVYASGSSSINRVDQEKQIELTYRFVAEAEQSKELLEAYRWKLMIL